MKRLVEDMREQLVISRSVFETAKADLPDPVAQRVLTRRIADLTMCIARADRYLGRGAAA